MSISINKITVHCDRCILNTRQLNVSWFLGEEDLNDIKQELESMGWKFVPKTLQQRPGFYCPLCISKK